MKVKNKFSKNSEAIFVFPIHDLYRKHNFRIVGGLEVEKLSYENVSEKKQRKKRKTKKNINPSNDPTLNNNHAKFGTVFQVSDARPELHLKKRQI